MNAEQKKFVVIAGLISLLVYTAALVVMSLIVAEAV